MKVLVTGGAGFIGSHTVDALMDRGYDVTILDSLEKPVHLKGKPDYLNPKAGFIQADVRSRNDMLNALDGAEAVIHLAAYQDYLPDFSKFFSVNSVATALIYELIVEKKLPIKKVVVASSQAVYGEGKYLCDKDGIVYPDIRPESQLRAGDWDIKCPVCGEKAQHQLTDESVVNPQNQYAVSKYTQELISLNLGRRYEIPTACLRYSIVQGPRQSFYNAYSGACRIFCLNMYFDRQPTVYEDGESLRDYINIQDVVDANLLVLEKPEADFGVFNVGGGRAYTVVEFAKIVAERFRKDIEPKIPGYYRFGDTRHIFSDISALESLGWKPKVSIEKSVDDYINYLNEQTDVEDILDYAEKKMKTLNVVREARK
ncbi:MAG: SDR family NAD(P)-dependent oxidoreductase [candidate division Zixibacteria bacterium]|nr:SDR family NAD(P)-dependent oxidoreductase [candidate division Zixibacteria bacterium]